LVTGYKHILGLQINNMIPIFNGLKQSEKLPEMVNA